MGSTGTTSMSSLSLFLRLPICLIRTLSSTSKVASRIGLRWSSIDVVSNDTIVFTESLADYFIEAPDKRPNQGKVKGKDCQDKDHNWKDWQQKKPPSTRLEKVKLMGRKNCQHLKAHALYAIAHVGYVTVWNRSHLTLQPRSSKATPHCQWMNPDLAWVHSNASAHSRTTHLHPHKRRIGSCL